MSVSAFAKRCASPVLFSEIKAFSCTEVNTGNSIMSLRGQGIVLQTDKRFVCMNAERGSIGSLILRDLQMV